MLLFGEGATAISTYRFRLIDDGQAVQESEFAFADDIEALKAAETLACDFDVELSDGRRFLALIHTRKKAQNHGSS